MNFIKDCESYKQFKYTVFLNKVDEWWLCFEKNLWKFEQIFKILLKILTVFKKILIKIWENLMKL